MSQQLEDEKNQAQLMIDNNEYLRYKIETDQSTMKKMRK